MAQLNLVLKLLQCKVLVFSVLSESTCVLTVFHLQCGELFCLPLLYCVNYHGLCVFKCFHFQGRN